MLRAVSYLPLALLFIAIAVPSNGQTTEATTEPAESPLRTADDFDGKIEYFDVRNNFELNCTIGGKITWKKNGTEISNFPELATHIAIKNPAGTEFSVLSIDGRATENDFGNYTCTNGASEQNWKVLARPHAKLPSDTNVVEGQKLKLTCRIIGKPHPPVVWTYSNTSEEVVNGTEVRAALGEDRVTLSTSEQGVMFGDLVITTAERSDAGWYKCTPSIEAAANATSSVTRLRVKDMYAALWPFLGICAEVFILCAIILVYEKRRTKPELDDSDTDNHDQKKS